MTPLQRTSGPHTPRSSMAVGRTTPPSSEPVEPRRGTSRPAARSGAAWVALARAVDRLCTEEGRSRPDGVSHEVLSDALATIETAVHAAADGEMPPLGAVPGFVYANRVAGTLRMIFLQELEGAGPGEAPELVRVLLAFERVEAALEADAGQRFLTKLSGIEAPKLLAEVAHDMRSPLGSILFLAERLRNGQSGPVTALQARQLGLVYSAALGLSGLANDVMELARGGLRLMDPEPVPFSVADIVQQTINIVRPMAEEKGLLLEATVPELDGRVG
ncbi:MAG: HAMP domain-containing histidine kinase, partial [Gemmatimonadetes bacterium]|nr:HAMP domain-containing histidine kinase [Gemmatimonadota bacterium]